MSNASDLRYELHGSGSKRMVFVMGFGTSLEAWHEQVSYFTQRKDFSVLVFDNRGAGTSPLRRPWTTVSELAHDLVGLLDRLGWDQCHLVGISMGGMIAMEATWWFAHRFLSVTLVNTHAGGRYSLPPWKGLVNFVKVFSLKDGPRRLECACELIFGSRARNDPELMTRLRNGFLNISSTDSSRPRVMPTPPAAIIAHLIAVSTHYVSEPRLKQIRDRGIPILVVYGTDDILVNPKNSLIIAEALSVTPLALQGVGHGLVNEAGAEFNLALNRHVDKAHKRHVFCKAQTLNSPIDTVPIVKLSHLDRMYLLIETPTLPMTISGFAEIRGHLARDAFFNVLGRWIESHPVLRCRPSSFLFYWIPHTLFDINEHVSFRTSDGTAHRKEIVLSEILSRPLSQDKPLWEVVVVEQTNAPTVVCIRLSHAIADGAASVGMLLSLLDEEFAAKSRDAFKAAVEEYHRERTKPLSSFYPLSALLKFFLFLLFLGKMLLSTVLVSFQFFWFILWWPRDVFKNSNPSNPDKRISFCQPMHLRDVKAVGKSIGVSVNAVMLACLAGAVAKTSQIKRDSLYCFVPFNMRLRGLAPLEAPGNHSSICFVDLPLRVADPRMRSKAIHAQMNRIKESAQPYLAYLALVMSGYVADYFVQRWMHFISRRAPVLLTNVPGPADTMYMSGVQVTEFSGMVPCPNEYSIGFCVFSFNETIYVSAMGSTTLQPSVQEVMEEFGNQWKLLHKSAQ